MRCISRFLPYLCGAMLLIGSLTGCGSTPFDMAYTPDSEVSSFNIISKPRPGVASPFAADLCVVGGNILLDNVDTSLIGAATLFDVNNRNTIYAKNAHERLHPASLTKVMTALVALKSSSPEQVLTASSAVDITESGAQVCGVKSGDTMTLEQALHILLMYSANDVAMLIAENIGGSIERFVEMMNEEAQALGATNTNFLNPHGLTEEGQYSTAYDQYLIFNRAIRYDSFREIISMVNYQTVYYDAGGNPKELSFGNTNRFLRGDYQPPGNITVIGGKTGTTNAAGNCLVLLAKDTMGANYISVILRAEGSEVLYEGKIELLKTIQP